MKNRTYLRKTVKIVLVVIIFLLLAAISYNAIPEYSLPAHVQINKLVVYKSQRQMLAFSDNKLVKTYIVSLGGEPVGDKEFEGDKKTPEGQYIINDKNPQSGYHKNLGISYPNDDDIEQAERLGKPPGGDVKIHGLRNRFWFIGKFHRWFDWTLGCIAVTDKEIDELYNAVQVGTPIEIYP